MPKKIAVEKTGGRRWPRYLLADQDGRFWTGNGWSADRRRALLFAAWNGVSHEYRRIEEQQWQAVRFRDFQAVMSIRVWSETAFSLKELRDYLHVACAIYMDVDRKDSGPVPESMVRVELDWAKLDEKPAQDHQERGEAE